MVKLNKRLIAPRYRQQATRYIFTGMSVSLIVRAISSTAILYGSVSMMVYSFLLMVNVWHLLMTTHIWVTLFLQIWSKKVTSCQNGNRCLVRLITFYDIFTVRRFALHGLCDNDSVRSSVCPSVCPSVTLVDCVDTVRPTIMISSPYDSPIILVSGDIKFMPRIACQAYQG